MLFFLATPEYNQVQSNTKKIRVHLSSGVAEIYEQHQDLIGKVDNDIIEIEANLENKVEKLKYVVQDGVFIVSTKNTISVDAQSTETGVYIYARRVKELNSKTSLDEISKEYELKKERLEKEEQKAAELKDSLPQVNSTTGKSTTTTTLAPLNSKLILLKEEVAFLKKVILVIKELKS